MSMTLLSFESKHSIWKVDMDRMVYMRFPKSEDPEAMVHIPLPYEGGEIGFTSVEPYWDAAGFWRLRFHCPDHPLGSGPVSSGYLVEFTDPDSPPELPE